MGIWHERLENIGSVLGSVLVKNMQTPPPFLKKNHFHFFVQIIAQCSESNEKSIFFIFAIFIFWIMMDFVHNFKCFYRPKMEKEILQKKCNFLKQIYEFMSFSFVIISFWDMVDFEFNNG